MSSERVGTIGVESMDAELLSQATALEKLSQRLLMAEQAAFTEETAKFSLTVPQFVTLAAIETFDEGRERMGKIADMARQCSATMTGIIDRLENMNLVRRVNNPHDRRSVLVELTDEGRVRLEEVRQVRRARLGRLLAAIDPSTRADVYQALVGYTDALEGSE